MTSDRDAILTNLRTVMKEIEKLEEKISLKPQKEAFYTVQIRQARQRRATLLHELSTCSLLLLRQQSEWSASVDRLCSKGRSLSVIEHGIEHNKSRREHGEFCLQPALSDLDWVVDEFVLSGFSGPQVSHSALTATVTIAFSGSATIRDLLEHCGGNVRHDHDGRTLWELVVPFDHLFSVNRRALSSAKAFRNAFSREVASRVVFHVSSANHGMTDLGKVIAKHITSQTT